MQNKLLRFQTAWCPQTATGISLKVNACNSLLPLAVYVCVSARAFAEEIEKSNGTLITKATAENGKAEQDPRKRVHFWAASPRLWPRHKECWARQVKGSGNNTGFVKEGHYRGQWLCFKASNSRQRDEANRICFFFLSFIQFSFIHRFLVISGWRKMFRQTDEIKQVHHMHTEDK